MSDDLMRDHYYATRRVARSHPLGSLTIIDQQGKIQVDRDGARRHGPNGRAYANSVIMNGLQNVFRSRDKAVALKYQRGALGHARRARRWESWAKLP